MTVIELPLIPPRADDAGTVVGGGEAPATAPRVIGLDLSLTSTGIATNHDTRRIRSTGTKTASIHSRSQRLHAIRNEILEWCRNAELVCIEGPSLHSQHGSAHDRSGLFWLVVDRLIHNDIPVAVIPPANRMKYTVGKGGGPSASKDACLAATIKRFPGRDITGNDEADAVILHAMGSDHLGWPVVIMPDHNRTALTACEWPDA